MASVMNIKQAVGIANESTMYVIGVRAIDEILKHASHPAEMMLAITNKLMDDGMSFDTFDKKPEFNYVDLLYRDLDEAKHFFLQDLDFLAIQLYRNGDVSVPLDVFNMVIEFDTEKAPISTL